MELYFAPLACSMATRIALYDAQIPATFTLVDLRSKRIAADGADFLMVNAMGQVPVLRTDDGALLTENPAVLQYVADRDSKVGFAPEGGLDRYRLQQWLCFITSELHKVIFIPLLDRTSTDGAKAYARGKLAARFAYLNRHLEGRSHLLDTFTVADAYLATILNWTRATAIELSEWPAINAYFAAICQHPSVARALAEETALWTEEQSRRK